jgi:CheY-like chemotaxis protein
MTRRARLAASEALVLDQTPYSCSKRLAGARILLVEDNTDCLNALRVLLEFNGAEVEGVECAADARAVLPELRPHVLITDLSMPGEDGFALVASVRKLAPDQGRDTPAVAFSALSPGDAGPRASDVGFQAFLRKPGDVLLIVPTVVRLLPPTLAP